MMEQRRALTLPFNVDKDNLMENPLRIPVTCRSPECGKLERQVSWTALAGCQIRHRDLHHKNGSVLFDHNHAAMVSLDMAGKKPRLILTDVLKTEDGKACIERMRQNCTPRRDRGNLKVSSTQRESGRCRDTRKSIQRSEIQDDINSSDQKTTSSPSKRSKVRRRLPNVDDEVDKEENKDVTEVKIGKDNGEDFKFSEVVDCGLSVSWEPDEDTRGCAEFSPASIKNHQTDPEKEIQHSMGSAKRKIKDASPQCNGTSSPKRPRQSVLRLTGEDGRDGGLASPCISLEDSGEDRDMESTIVQFTVGADDPTEIVVPIISRNLETEDFIGSPGSSPSSGQDTINKSIPLEPIVLSSDDEESVDIPNHCSPESFTGDNGGVIQEQSPQEAEAKLQELSDIELLQLDGDDPPGSVSPIPIVEYSSLDMPFSTLYCGAYQGKSNGEFMITEEQLIIPLQDTSGKVELMLNIARAELRRYSVWEREELEAQELYYRGHEEPSPAAFLLLCVSETAAAAAQQDLVKLCVKQGGTTHNGKGSPFILLSLTNPPDGMEGALLRSFLDIDCLNSLADEKPIVPHSTADRVVCLEGIHSPVLTLDNSIELMRRTGLDSQLLSLLGLENTEEEEYSHTDVNTTPLIQLEVDSQEESASASERDKGTPLKPEGDQKEDKLKNPAEKKKDEPTTAYTLCHRRTKGSYSVSVCKLDSSWTKYKHQGLARRLIQFPPPPMKGGITVTMEDLQCLDNGQFLNDVIIDFYLKYVLQMSSAAVAERTHIFSSFFYKQLTRRDNASEGLTSDSCQRQRRHHRVKTWTRHVDIFKKDFLFVPVNQESHWYLVVICFPGLEEASTGLNSETAGSNSRTDEFQDQKEAQGSKSPNDNTETPPTLSHSDNEDSQTEKAPEKATKDPPPGPVNCTERTCQRKTVCKRPCILIMDSLKVSLHERVFKLLRDYLQSEWEVRRGSSRDFGSDQMQSSHCQVPLQDNSSDCGLYLLQYVESFLKDPVVHFDLPLHLERWFPRQLVRRKREEIRDLVLNLYRKQNLDGNT